MNKERNKKILPLYDPQKNVKQIYLMKAVRKMLEVKFKF